MTRPRATRASVRYGQQSRPVVADGGVELAVKAVAGAARTAAEGAAALHHELRDHAVEDEPIVESEPREVREVRDVQGRDVGHQADDEIALVRAHAGVPGLPRGKIEHRWRQQPD